MRLSYLYFGYTTVIDLSAANSELIETLRSEPLRPDIHTCSDGLALANGFRMAEDDPETRLDNDDNWLYDRYPNQEVPERYDLAAHSPTATVRRIVDRGGICVKTYFENGFGGTAEVTWDMPSVEIIRDVVAAGHEHGVPVLIHANSYASQLFATQAGVDIVAHGMWHWGDVMDFLEVDELPETHRALLIEIAQRQIGYQPTIGVLASQRALFDTGFLADPLLAHSLPGEHIDWLESAAGRWHRNALVAMFSSVLGGKDDHELYVLFDRFANKAKTVTRVLAEHDARLLFGTDRDERLTTFPSLMTKRMEFHASIESRGLCSSTRRLARLPTSIDPISRSRWNARALSRVADSKILRRETPASSHASISR